MPDEDPGLLGNLPRSRPGTRSDKRAPGADPDAVEAGKSGAEPGKAASKPAAKRSQAAKPGSKRSSGAKKPAKAQPVPVSVAEPTAERDQAGDRGSGPLRSAAKAAGTGLRVAEGVTREVLRRLPRP